MPKFNEDEVRREARELIMNVLNRKKSKIKPEEIVEGVSLTVQLGIDSLDILQILAVVEKKYKLKIPEEDLMKMDDLGGIVKTTKKYWPAETEA